MNRPVHSETSVKKSSAGASVARLALAPLLLLLCIGCHQKGDARLPGAADRKPLPVDPAFNETALFLAGKELPGTSTLSGYCGQNQYIQYRKRMDANWSRLQESNQKKIEAWKEAHLPRRYTKTVFYPFSGPDILNALLFFPGGDDYILFGLESPGEIPRPHAMPAGSLSPGLSGLSAALNNVLNVNYFKTVEMGKAVSTNSFNSITSVMMFFLSRMGYEVLDVKKVWIDENSALGLSPSKAKGSKMIAGMEILLLKSGGEVKRARYFQLNVIDWSLEVHPHFIPFLESYGRYTTIVKSASYLMHNEKKFTGMRALTLSHSDYILQDDSGIALRYFPRDEWKLTFHGVYSKPVPLFAHRYQQDLSDAMRKHSTGPLPFSYGYNFGENESNLMLAERIRK